MDIYRSDREMALVALGGNALIRPGDTPNIETQEKNAEEVVAQLMTLVERDLNLVITHGNGPQVGNLLLKNEAAHEHLPRMPLDVLVAETEGSMGYILQQAFLNHFRFREVQRYVVTVITQVLVSPNDSAFSKPTKPIGMWFSKEDADEMAKQFGWQMIRDGDRGYRRVVPSPRPLKIVQRHMIRHSAREGNIVIAAGGGGVPVKVDANGRYEGIEAVIDKDYTSAMLATEIKADTLIILMEEPKISIHFGAPKQRPLDRVTASEMTDHLAEGHFPAGSVGPKVEAAIQFVQRGGKRAVITRADRLAAALDGDDGTMVVP
ncbi:MAG: carbamate kinase [Deltaproteobacteria bacterium]|nr:carbamate kinase [Deltaproteobacteria bacterium]